MVEVLAVEDSRATKEVSGCPSTLRLHVSSSNISLLTLYLAFRDRNAGSAANARKPTDEVEGARRGGRGEGRGRGRPFDRHSRTVGG